MAKTYFVGTRNQVKRIDNHTYPGTTLTPIGDADTIWRDVMTHPTNEDKVIIVGSSLAVGPGGSNNSIQISSDAGATWTTPGGTWDTLADYFYEVWWCENGTTIVATSAFGYVALSTDSGATFDLLPQIAAGAYFQTAGVHALDENTIVVAGSLGDGITQTECYVWKWDGVSWTPLNGGLSLAHPGAAPGDEIGNANGIWISKDENTIIVATGYTNQVSTDGGLTFTGNTDPGLPPVYMNRAGAHLTWYPSYQIDLITPIEAFRHTGGSSIQITESIDEGLTWPRTRWYNFNTLTPITYPVGNNGYNIIAAHFYTLENGYYGDKDYLFVTTDRGETGVVVDQLGSGGETFSVVNAVWTGQTILSENPILYTLVDCCYNQEFLDENGNIVVFEYNGDCFGKCPEELLGSVITAFAPQTDNGLYSGSGCFILTEIQSYPLDPYVIALFEREFNKTLTTTVDTCEECCIVFPCFKLTDCEGLQQPIYTGTNLSANLGEVITIEDVEGCWLVEQSDITCVDVPEITVIKCYATCDDCLPEPAPIKTPTNRVVLPNYTTGNCDPELVEKAFCKHGEMIYKQVLEARFKITACCPADEDKVTMTYEKMKLNLLKSTNPTPDPCNPKCYRYQATIFDGFSAITTYTDCTGRDQTIETFVSVNVQYLDFCGLDSNPPTIVITNFTTLEEVTYTLQPVEDCEI